MQIASIAAQPAPAAPRFTGGIEFEGSGRFTKFAASATRYVYGDQAGYDSLQQAIDAVTFLTVGARLPAAGIFERDGRFHARRLDNEVTFASGTSWKGFWKLEQFPADRELLDGSARGRTTRSEDLRAVVDGAQRIDVTHLPVAGSAPTS